MSDPVRELARAKMNLRLRVLGRDGDGYHALETLFLRLHLADEVELRPGGDGIGLEVEAAPPGAPDPSNAGEEGAQGTLFPAGRDAAARSASAAQGEGDGKAGAGDDGTADDPATGDGPTDRASGDLRKDAAGLARDRAEDDVAAPIDIDDVPAGSDNLCWRAARSFYDELGEAPDVSIRLVKRVPAAGGLGGGSADAAAVLRGLSRLHGSPLPPEALMRLAGELGSDVPFALLDRPVALGWERGRRLMPLDPPAARPMLLLVPEVRVSTPEAFGWLDEDRKRADTAAIREDGGTEPDADDGGGDGKDADGSGTERAADRAGATDEAPTGPGRDPGGGEGPRTPLGRSGPSAQRSAAALPPAAEMDRWDVLLSLRGNDFEAPVFARIPELAWWKEELLGEGAEAVLLCGSGSTLCGIFGDERRRDAAADRLRESGELRVVRTRGPV